MKSNEILEEALKRDTARAVARALGVTEQAVSEWRKKKHLPAEHALYLADYLGLPEPNLYELIAEGARHEGRREWLRKKAHAASVSALAIASVFAVLSAVSATDASLIFQGGSEAYNIALLSIMRNPGMVIPGLRAVSLGATWCPRACPRSSAPPARLRSGAGHRRTRVRTGHPRPGACVPARPSG